MIRLTFSPAMVCGHSLNWLPTGMPRPEAGPVSDSVTPMFTSAKAVVASSAAAAARVLRNNFMVVSIGLRMNLGFSGQG